MNWRSPFAARPRALFVLVLLTVAFGPMLLAAPAAASTPHSIISNGTVQLGVHAEGHLNVPGPASSGGSGTPFVGLRFSNNFEATASGCLCEGWGVADAISGVTGHVNEVEGGPTANITPGVPVATGSTVVSTVNVGGVFLVTHDFHPSTTSNLYEVTVTILNVSASTVTDLRYRRVMDWDVEPTVFNEFVTINEGNAEALLFSNNNGFATTNPLGSRTDSLQGGIVLAEGPFEDLGPADHGALFDFGFGSLAAGASMSFNIYYGAAATEADALAALGAVEAEVYSLGQANNEGGLPPTVGAPNTFIFGFAGVGGDPVNLPPTALDDAASTTQNNSVNIPVLDNDTDPEDDDLTVTNLTEPENGSVAVGEANTVDYTPNEGFSGTDTFTYTANDGNSNSNVATVTVTVEGDNQPPVAVDDEAATAQNTAVNINVLANDSDPDEDTLTVANVTVPSNGAAVVQPNQTVTYTPNAGFSGTDSFTYTANDGSVDSNVATVIVNVGQADSCVNTGAGCTLVTDNGTTNAGNPVSVQMTVPAGAPPGLYTIRELPDPVANSKGAAEYTAPEGDTVLTITVSCDESQCKKKKLAILDKIVIVIKESPAGTEILPPCDLTIKIGRRVFHITNPPPCLDSVVRNGNSGANPGDLVWRVDVLGGDPTIKGRG